MVSDERRPVMIGVGQVRANRERTVEGAREPFRLMIDAIVEASFDSHVDPGFIDAVYAVHVASWAYDELAGRLSSQISGLKNGRSLVDTGVGGQRPAELLETAAARIAAGESRLAIVVGGEAQASATALNRAGVDPVSHGWSARPGEPADLTATGLRSSRMEAAGLLLPTRVYPLFENALRHASGRTPEEGARGSAALYAAFSQVAATNPAAWNPGVRTAAEIGTVGPGNRMVCEPYPLAVNAMPHVDQAAAVFVASLAEARRRRVPENRIVHIWGGAGAHDAVDVLDRPSFARSDALADVLDRTLDACGLQAADLDVIDVYSCFPVVPKLVGAHLGIAPPVGVTGGHSAFGGPLSSYTLHALVAVAHRIRAGARRALVHGNGGYLTHQHALVLARDPHPRGYVGDPVPRDTARPGPAVVDAVDHEELTVETATVEHDRDGRVAQGFLVARTAAGGRYAASTAPGDLGSAGALSLERGEIVGRRVRVTTKGEHAVVHSG